MSWSGHRLSVLRGARISVLLSVLAFSWSMGAFLGEDAQAREDVVPGSRYVPARAAALGDAFLPLADDPASALTYNPAGLALGSNKGVHVELMNLQLYGTNTYFSALDVQHYDFYKVTSLNSYLPALKRSPGAYQGVGYSYFPTIYAKGFAFGVLAQEQVSGKYNAADDTVDYRSNYQLIPTAGFGLRLAEGIVRVGYSIQYVNQASGQVNALPAGSVQGYNEGLSKGSGLSHTLGYALTFPYRYLPQLNVVARNLFTTRFKGGGIMPFAKSSTGTPDNEQTTIDVSLSTVQKIGAGAEFSWVFEDRDATDRSGISLLGRMAVGLEFDFRRAFYLRAGWGSGYPNAGLGLRRKKHEFSFSWASEEVGNGYHDRQETRYLLQYQVRAF